MNQKHVPTVPPASAPKQEATPEAQQSRSIAHIGQSVNCLASHPAASATRRKVETQGTALSPLSTDDVLSITANVIGRLRVSLQAVVADKINLERALAFARSQVIDEPATTKYHSIDGLEKRLVRLVHRKVGVKVQVRRCPTRSFTKIDVDDDANCTKDPNSEVPSAPSLAERSQHWNSLSKQIASKPSLKSLTFRAQRYVREPVDAKDVTATALLLATERMNNGMVTFPSPDHCCAWLFEAVRRVGLQQRRRRQKEVRELTVGRDKEGRQTDRTWGTQGDHESKIIEDFEYHEKRELIAALFGQVPIQYRRAIEEEVSRQQLKPRPALSTKERLRLMRARRHIIRFLAANGIVGATFITANDNDYDM